MTKSHTSISRELYGVLGTIAESSAVRSQWNKAFAKKGIDACLTKYPTTVQTLPERLSEMFHFDRRAYLVGDALQSAVFSLLDSCDPSVTEQKVNVVINKDGVLTGMWLEHPHSLQVILAKCA